MPDSACSAYRIHQTIPIPHTPLIIFFAVFLFCPGADVSVIEINEIVNNWLTISVYIAESAPQSISCSDSTFRKKKPRIPAITLEGTSIFWNTFTFARNNVPIQSIILARPNANMNFITFSLKCYFMTPVVSNSKFDPSMQTVPVVNLPCPNSIFCCQPVSILRHFLFQSHRNATFRR